MSWHDDPGIKMTELNEKKLKSLAYVAWLLRSNDELLRGLDHVVVEQMLREGIRKLHDSAICSRGCGKYLGHAHWSRDAEVIVGDHAGRASRAATAQLRHEHVVPVQIVVRAIWAMGPDATPVDVEQKIRKLSIVAIISRDEDRLLAAQRRPIEFTLDEYEVDPWIRYRHTLLRDGTALIDCIRPPIGVML